MDVSVRESKWIGDSCWVVLECLQILMKLGGGGGGMDRFV